MKRCALTNSRALAPDSSLVRIDDLSNNGQAQACARALQVVSIGTATAVIGDAIESFEYPFEMLRFDADAIITDPDVYIQMAFDIGAHSKTAGSNAIYVRESASCERANGACATSEHGPKVKSS